MIDEFADQRRKLKQYTLMGRRFVRSQQEIKRNMEFFAGITCDWDVAEDIYKDLSDAYLNISKIVQRAYLELEEKLEDRDE